MAGSTASGSSAFFSPWEPMPAFAKPPSDTALTDRIKLLVKFAITNGPSFIDMMRQKQAGDSKFAFLANGEGSDYFRWLLYATAYNISTDRPLPVGTFPPHATSGATSPPAAPPAAPPQYHPPPGGPPAPPGHLSHAPPPPHPLQHPFPGGGYYPAPPHPAAPPPPFAAPPPPHAMHHQPQPPPGYPPPNPHHQPQPPAPPAPPTTAPPPAAEQPPPPPMPPPSAGPGASAASGSAVQSVFGLPGEIVTEFSTILDSLTSSKESIKSAASWFMTHQLHATGLALVAAGRAVGYSDGEKQLHLIYLANDVLFKGLAQRIAMGHTTDGISSAFQPVIGAMLAAAYNTAGRSDKIRERLDKILRFWSEKHVYGVDVMTMIEDAAFNTDDPATLLQAVHPEPVKPPAPQTAASASAPWQQAPPQGQPAAPWIQAAVVHPPGPSTSGGWGPPPAAAAQSAQAAAAAGVSPWGPPSGPPPYGHLAPPPPYATPLGAPPSHHQGPSPPQQPVPWFGGSGAPGGPGGPAPPPPSLQQQQQHPVPGVAGPTAPPYAQSTTPLAPGLLSVAPSPAAPAAGAAPMTNLQAKAAHIAAELAAAAAAAAMAAAATVGVVPLGNTKPVAPLPGPDLAGIPVSSTNFPPGLIPELVKEKNLCEVPYTPLDPADIEKAGLPPPPEKDSYLLARLDRFYVDLKDYRPGLSRADLDDAIRGGRIRSRSEEPEDVDGSRRRGRGQAGVLNDGSFAGGRNVSKYAGLGTHNAAEDNGGDGMGGGPDEDDMYSEYRKQRSGSYHEMIFKSSAAAGAWR